MADYLDELVQRISTKANLKGFDDLNKAQRRAIKQNDLLGKSLRNAFGFFLGIQGVRSIIQTSREIDLLQRSIKGLTGSTQDFQYLRQEAYRTGTSLTDMGKAYKNFYSAAKMSGFDKSQIQGMFSNVLVAGRGIGANQQQIGAALLALEQMLSKGKVSMEELRRQMGNALPGAFEIAAKSMGVTTKKFNEMLKAGLDANTFVPRFTAMLKKELGKGFAENIKSLDFALVNLSTAWVEFQANIMQGESGEAFRQLVVELTNILRSQELYRGLQIISKGLALIIRSLKWILMFWGVKKLIEFIRYIKYLRTEIWKVAIGTREAALATRLLAIGFTQLTNKQIGEGLLTITKGLWGMMAPLLKLMLLFEGIWGIIKVIQDLWLTFADPTADTYFRDLLNLIQGKKNKENGEKSYTTEEKDAFVKGGRAKGQQLWFKQNKNGTWDYVNTEDTMTRGAVITSSPPKKQSLDRFGNVTGYAAPLIPNAGYSGQLPDISGSFGDKRTSNVTNNWTVNVYAPDGQAQTIVQSFEDALGGFLDKYQMGYA